MLDSTLTLASSTTTTSFENKLTLRFPNAQERKQEKEILESKVEQGVQQLEVIAGNINTLAT